MRISIELSSFDKGGLEKVAFDTALEFRKSGHDVFFFVSDSMGEYATRAKSENFKIFQLPKFGRPLIYSWLLHKNRIQITLNHFTYFGLKPSRFLRIPSVSVIHNNYAFLNPKQKKKFLSHDRYVSKYVGVSELSSNYIIENFGVQAKRVQTIPNGLPPRESVGETLSIGIDSALQLQGNSSTHTVLLNVAAINVHKGHSFLIRAMSHVVSERPNVVLICIGNTHDLEHSKKLQREIVLRGLQANVYLLGHTPNPSHLYEIADIFVLPSLIEGWSMAMLEAMQHKLPMILAEVGGATEVFEAGAAGTLIENFAGNPNSFSHEELQHAALDWNANPKAVHTLARTIIEMVDNLGYWKARAEVNAELVSTKYSLEKCTKAYIRLFEDLLKVG